MQASDQQSLLGSGRDLVLKTLNERAIAIPLMPNQVRVLVGVGGLALDGVGGGSFSLGSRGCREQYRTECRGNAFALAPCIGHLVAAGATFVVRAGIAHYRSRGFPVASSAVTFVAGLLALPIGIETKGQPLPV